jgi:hypothetical protein
MQAHEDEERTLEPAVNAALDAMGDAIERLQPVEAVSVKQASYAERVRLDKVVAMGQRIRSEAEYLPLADRLFDAAVAERSARFWLDTQDVLAVLKARAERQFEGAAQ